MRKEKDFIGIAEIPADALYGIHALRAAENFPDTTLFHIEWYQAIGLVKEACYKTYKSFKKAVIEKKGNDSNIIRQINDYVIEAMIQSASEIAKGDYFSHFIIPAVSGGAGTSINMNINEIIANASLKKMNLALGSYNKIDPIEDANIYQSTNDVIPTSLKVAVIGLLNQLEESINKLRGKVEALENEYRNTMRIAHTQMQDAVPSSYGVLFSTYSEALSRDWWRVSKCFERIKVVNLGGSAVGTGLAVPRFFIMEVINELQKLTGFPISRSENLPDATNNLDTFVEVHAIMKSHAVNLEKMMSDIRLLSSDLITDRDMSIPQKQLGSSIMPSKVNPVIPEFAISAAHKIYSNDILISSLCAQGCLDLNAYIPVIGHALIESLKLLIAMDKTIAENLLSGLEINNEKAIEKLLKSPAITTALTPYIGYNKATELAKEMREHKLNVFEANSKIQIIKKEKLEEILKPSNLLKLGFSLNDIEDLA